jgi:hypothetical protein
MCEQRDDGVGAGAGWRGVQLAQEMALINEDAFGWDSVEAATAYKQVLVRVVSGNSSSSSTIISLCHRL